MKKQKFSIARVFIGVIVALLLIAVWFYIDYKIRERNYPFDWKYKKPILELIDDAGMSDSYYEITSYGGEVYEMRFKTIVISEGTLREAIDVFNAVTDYVDEHEDHPMHGKDLIITVGIKHDASPGYLQIEHLEGKTYVLLTEAEMVAESYSMLCDLKYGVDELHVNRCNFGVEGLLDLPDLKKLDCLYCYYLGSKETSPNNADIRKLREKFPDCEIRVDWETIE